jgi:putative RecB family exonuclease
VARYSHSKLSTFEQCPQRYKFRYIDGIKTDKKSIEAFLGSRVHETLEKLYSDLRLSKLDTLEQLIAFYEQQWEKNYSPEIEVVRADMNPGNYLDTGKRMIRSYYRRFHPFNQEITVDLELPVSFPLDKDTLFNGYVDRVAKNGDHHYEIHDYKTSRVLPSQAQIEKDHQLPLYEVAIRHRWPDAEKVTLIWHYLASETELKTTKTEGELKQLKGQTLKLVREIESTENFPVHESALCDWCEYYDICPAKAHGASVATLPPPEFKADTGVTLVDRYAALKEQAREAQKQLKEELEKLENAIFEYAESNGVNVIVGSEKKVTIREKTVTSLPTKSTDPEEYAAVVDLLRGAGQWDKVSALDYRAALSSLNSSELQDRVGKQLQQYIRTEVRKSISISRRNQSN